MRATITVNGDTLLDDDLNNWQQRPPEQLAHLIKPGHQPQPWTKPMMVALADAALTNQPISIDVTTNDAGWTMDVR